MGAQVQPGPLERLQQLPRMEPDRFAACIQQRLQEAAGQGGRTHGIQQQAYLHTGTGTFDQGIAQRGAGVVRVEDVVLQMHVVARLCDGFHQGSVGGGAIHQPGHFGGAARCQPGGGLGDLGQLGAVGIGWADVAVVLQDR
ncbi:hypothetical protein G6F35_018408 [Rhizopus arrhizus]|nr:hypothetical protein G6F35_018408 [Rhizopus arrhizus]